VKGAGDKRDNRGYGCSRVSATNRGVAAVLHYLDVMIGFVFTMLVLSLAVTAMVQAVPVYLRNLKGAALQQGLIDLIVRISHDPATRTQIVGQGRELLGHLLRDPLLTPQRTGVMAWLYAAFWPPYQRPPISRPRASVMHREEFVRLLLDFAGTDDRPDDLPGLAIARKQARLLIGVDHPAKPGEQSADNRAEARALLERVRSRIANLEGLHPDWSSSKRADQAMLEILLFGPTQPFMSRLVGWYDQTIDRVEAAFTARVRNWTTAISFLLVLVLQLDSFNLLARLNADPVLREKVVESALTAMANDSVNPAKLGGNDNTNSDTATTTGADQNVPAATTGDAQADKKRPTPSQNSQAIACANRALVKIEGKKDNEINFTMSRYADCMGMSQATELRLVEWPKNFNDWLKKWREPETSPLLRVLGMLLSLGLLSLGAPFWYEVLSNLIKLRSTIARKDEKARTERQTTQVAG
jgi:hypothetical protein